MSERRVGIVEVLAAIMGLIVIMLAIAVVIAWSYPKAAQGVVSRLASGSPWLASATGEAGSISEDVATRAREGWEYRFAGPFARLTGGVTETDVSTATVDSTFPVDECESCHEGFMERVRFSVVYAPHEPHVSGGIGCERCHAASGPTRDTVPAMSGCTECHLQTQLADECKTCHPPGSLFHGAALAGDRETGMECGTCHRPERLVAGARPREVSSFDSSPASCGGCHAESFCDRCHPAAHPAGYSPQHIVDFRERTVTHQECYTCHPSEWCAMRCHVR